MGVVHFMGLGKAVGAVTCAVDYIEKALDLLKKQNPPEGVQQLFRGSGGISHYEVDKGKIEALVLFTSIEIIERKMIASPYLGKPKPGQVRDELLKILEKVWRRVDKDKGRVIYWCEVNIDDFRDCFDKAIKIFYRFSPPGKQGKEIWCNLTGGTNSIGFALLSAARFTALSTKNYLIAQRQEFNNSIIVPKSIRINPNYDNYFHILSFLKTNVDTANFYRILHILKSCDSLHTKELWSRLTSNGYFSNGNFDVFKRDYLLKLYGLGYTNYDSTKDLITITETGINFLKDFENLEEELALGEKIKNGKVDIVNESRNWSWFQEVDKF